METTTLVPKGLLASGREGGPVVLEVEAQDEGVLVRVLNSPVGVEIAAGTPLGVVADGDAPGAAALAAARAFDPGSGDIYDDEQMLRRGFLWQAYKKTSNSSKETPP